mmetsp:Transcript_12896/g.23180  ORF Transcript_12896/g.23180 Transcript_12896/m.23180 type:complete len:97 (-) Transcript_12896:761-1051(-)
MMIQRVDLRGRHVLVVEDIVDTGLTLKEIKSELKRKGCASVHTASLLVKKTHKRIENAPPVEYVAFEIEDEFVVGYGLDYNQSLRHLPFVAVFKQS